jgi:outer membrane receptor protein involved in Fe transport
MYKYLILLLLMLTQAHVAVSAAGGDGFTVKGLVVDSITGEGEPYATVRVEKAGVPGEAVKMLVTKSDGSFTFSLADKGKYRLTVSSMGRADIVKDFTLEAGKPAVDLGKMPIHDAANVLAGVEVTAQKPLVTADIDKIGYDVESDPDSKTNTVMEMLRKVPMVTVDGEDNIQVNGSSSFKVYVNGRPNNMMSNNPKEVLKSMPANTIKKIEVITNPGPKYDAEGVGGILNIVTVGSGFEGYTVTVSANGSNTGAGGGLFGTVKAGKFTVSARYNYNHNSQPRSYSGSTLTVTDENPSSASANIESEGSSKSRSNFQSGSLEASYEIDTLNLVTASFGLWGNNYSSRGTSSTVGTSPLDGGGLYSYSMPSHSRNSWFSIEGSVDYQRLFKVKDRMLTFSYRISTDPETSDSYTDYDDMDAVADWQDYLQRLENQHNDGSQRTTEHTFQLDYTTPIGKLHTLEAGAKYILRNNSSENDRYTMAATATGDYEFDEDHSSHYRHNNDIIAAYLGYGLKWKKLSGRFGLRYEHTIQDVKYLLGRGDDFRKDFDDFVPSASIGYRLTDTQNLRLGYNMRIYRPGIWYLNPYLDDSNPTSISQGNPNLVSEKSHSFSLGYNSFTTKLSVNLSLRYSFTNNSIESVSSLVNDNDIAGLQNPTGKSVLYTTYRNIGKTRSANLSAYVNYNPFTTTRIYVNMYGGWKYLSDGGDLSNHGWNMFAYGGVQQTLPKDWRISLNMYGQTPWISLQGKGDGQFGYTLSVTKQMLKNRLSISAFAGNFFKKYMRYENTTTSTGFTQRSWSKFNQQHFGVSVSFRIGELKASVKKAERTISNDDVKEGGQQGGGQ